MGIETFEFTDIIIIESLKEHEEKTGKKLENFLKDRFGEIINVIYHDVNTKREFYDLFEEIINKTSNGFLPIIHLEIHGHRSNMGLLLKSNELINWQYLYIYCKELNFNLKNNLFLTLAVCRGAHLIKRVVPYDRCPWAFIIGSFKDLWVDKLFNDFSTFYSTLLEKKDIDLAYQELIKINPDADFEIIDSVRTFSIIRNYFQQVIEKEKVEKTQGKIMLKSFLRGSSFEKAKEFLNINYNTKILAKDDIVDYFSSNYILSTENLEDDFERFFYFWREFDKNERGKTKS